MPIQKKRNGEYKIPSGTLVYTCFTSDFFVEEADAWRAEAWAIMRTRIDLRPYSIGKWVEQVVVGGESGNEARVCNFDWVMELHDLCAEQQLAFWFKQTGAKFINDNKLYHINRKFQHAQARKAGINL